MRMAFCASVTASLGRPPVAKPLARLMAESKSAAVWAMTAPPKKRTSCATTAQEIACRKRQYHMGLRRDFECRETGFSAVRSGCPPPGRSTAALEMARLSAVLTHHYAFPCAGSQALGAQRFRAQKLRFAFRV